MLKKYVQRVNRFSIEIETRLWQSLNKDNENNNPGAGQEPEKRVIERNDWDEDNNTSLESDFKESAIDCDELEGTKSISSRGKLGESGESLYKSASSGSCFDGSITQHGSITLDSNISLSEDINSNSPKEETNIESISSDQEGNNVNNNNDGTKMRKNA